MLPGGSRSSRTASACRTFLRRERCKLKQFAAKSKSPGCLTPGKNAKKCKKIRPEAAYTPVKSFCCRTERSGLPRIRACCMSRVCFRSRLRQGVPMRLQSPPGMLRIRIRMHPADGAENTSGRGKACFPRLLACRCGRFSARGQCSLCSAPLASLMARAKASVMPMPRMRITE